MSLVEDTPAPEEDTPNPETTEVNGWNWSENMKGEGDRPEWFMDKYNSVEEQAKAYPELASKFGSFTGAPEKYTVSFPEDEDGNPLGEWASGEDDPMIQDFMEMSKDMGMSQEGFTRLLHSYAKWEIDRVEADKAAQIKQLGENPQKRLGDIMDYVSANLDDEMTNAVKNELLVSAEGVRAVEALINISREKSIPTNASPTPGYTEHDYRAAVRDERWQSDPNFRKEHQQKYAKIAPGDHMEVRG